MRDRPKPQGLDLTPVRPGHLRPSLFHEPSSREGFVGRVDLGGCPPRSSGKEVASPLRVLAREIPGNMALDIVRWRSVAPCSACGQFQSIGDVNRAQVSR